MQNGSIPGAQHIWGREAGHITYGRNRVSPSSTLLVTFRAVVRKRRRSAATDADLNSAAPVAHLDIQQRRHIQVEGGASRLPRMGALPPRVSLPK